MKRFIQFLRATMIGGIAVILPVYILFFVFTAIYNLLMDNLIKPLSENLLSGIESAGIIRDGIAFLIIVAASFLIGVLVKTRFGIFLHNGIEKKILGKIPGYNLIRDTFKNFTNPKGSPFSSVALVQLFASPTLCTAFITEEHSNGMISVFVPFGLNPTGGQIYHLPKEQVKKLDVSVQDTMKSLFGCGAGSNILFDAYDKQE